MVLRNERQMNVVKHAFEDIVWTFNEKLKQFIRERHGVATHVNTSPNSLGRLDKHKINLTHRQLHPTAIGLIDLHESSKDVGQSGIISPWADLSMLNNADINKYPNIKFKLYEFISQHFPEPALRFNANNIVEFNQILDKMVLSSYIDLDYRIPDKSKGGDNK